MKLDYKLKIEDPKTHYVAVSLTVARPTGVDSLRFFLPSWSPGSYLMREYARHVRKPRALNAGGEFLDLIQIDKGVWEVSWKKNPPKGDAQSVTFSYEVYCHELTVRTSHVDSSHAFIHGPSVFVGVEGHDGEVSLAINFPPLWSKISTGLKDISPTRGEFLYSAPDYDTFIDAPIEIGCHDTNGFRVGGLDHEVAFYGEPLPHKEKILADMKTIVETVSGIMKEIPYDRYVFITHLVPGKYGGLEHLNSTALQYSPLDWQNRKGYLQWLALVAHEYFHTWNVKRIRPQELGPFDYQKEAMTSLLWLAEGLTSFMDELFVLRSGLCTMEEYLDMQKANLNRYIGTPGRLFHSLEDSSFNSWIKLYRPDENSNNSSVSYYLKGGIAFFVLNAYFTQKGVKVDAFLDKLWARYKANPKLGTNREEVFALVEEMGGKEARDVFENMVCTTQEISLEAELSKMGLSLEWDASDAPYIGANVDFDGDRAIVKSVVLDSPAMKGGLNADDEIIALNGMRILRKEWQDIAKALMHETSYRLTVSRLNRLCEIEVTPGRAPKTIKAIKIVDNDLAKRTFLVI